MSLISINDSSDDKQRYECIGCDRLPQTLKERCQSDEDANGAQESPHPHPDNRQSNPYRSEKRHDQHTGRKVFVKEDVAFPRTLGALLFCRDIG